ncbi:MAG: family 78 glycoside hydrolase catalytic domain [Terrimicrobiaceae bacterium]
MKNSGFKRCFNFVLSKAMLQILICGAPLFAQSNLPLPTQTANEVAGFIPTALRCEYRIDPLGIDSVNPRLEWTYKTNNPSARGVSQSAYEVIVSSSPNLLAENTGDLWDSGKVPSDQMSQVSYGGKPLTSNQACWWKVRTWDQNGKVSEWSPGARWTMGILKQEDWQGAKWIGAPNESKKSTPPNLDGPREKYETVLLRREFAIEPGLTRALVQVCGLGQYEMTLNGSKVGNDVMAPGWSQYEKTCLYDTYDITSSLRAGQNAVGLLLGNGMYLVHRDKKRFSSNTIITWEYRPIQAIGLIRLEYADGTVKHIVTDDQWQSFSGPITYSSIYGGEDYDARLEPQNWNKPDFDSAAWDKPQLLGGPGGILKGSSCAAEPIRAFESLVPVQQKEIRPGVTSYDLGQNASIMLRMKVNGPPGSVVRVIPSELVNEDGAVTSPKSIMWQYTLKGDQEENYFSKFFYMGARYLQVELIPPTGSSVVPRIDSIEGVVIHADATPTGQFSCSNDLFNRIYNLVRWAMQNNMVSILTDCPGRERRGWLEQDHLNGPGLRYSWDMASAFTKITNDITDAQRTDGLVFTTAPHYSHSRRPFADSPEWSSACILIPWQQYQYSGDLALLNRAYNTMQAYQDFLGRQAKDNIVSYGIGDWGGPSITPIPLTSTAYYYEDTTILAQVAKLLGKTEDAARYTQQAEQIRAAFNQTFFNSQTHQYGSGEKVGSQCSNSIALAMGLAEPANRQAILKNIVKDVREKGLAAGEIGHRYLLRALADAGRSDVIYALHNQSDKPGYGYQLKQGKTSLTESWNGGGSQDHFMLGHINEWLYHDLAGIQPDPAGPGFKKFIIKPAILASLTWVKASYDSASGPIVSEWQYDGQNVTLHVGVPVNTTATIYVPTLDANSVLESGRPVAQAAAIQFLQMEGSYAMFQVGSGNYTFQSKLRGIP